MSSLRAVQVGVPCAGQLPIYAQFGFGAMLDLFLYDESFII